MATPPWYASLPNMDPQYLAYMRDEWGRPVYDERGLFESLSLEGAQVGLSWRTILVKREAYRRDFHGFDVDRVAEMTPSDVERIMSTSKEPDTAPADTVVLHRGKLESVIHNARLIQRLRAEDSLASILVTPK